LCFAAAAAGNRSQGALVTYPNVSSEIRYGSRRILLQFKNPMRCGVEQCRR